LTKKFVKDRLRAMLELEVIETPAVAATLLDPIKRRLLAELATPASAAALAQRVGLARQKVNYHLRALEKCNLVEPADSRRWGGITERRMVATAASYVVSPLALGPIAADPARSALAARAVREVGELWRRARESQKRLATLSIDAVIRFKSPEDRAAFTSDLAAAVSGLVARYHDEHAEGGRPHRLVVAAYPAPAETPTTTN
jgi:DNA-binding transcriptional ArsR family regulator